MPVSVHTMALEEISGEMSYQAWSRPTNYQRISHKIGHGQGWIRRSPACPQYMLLQCNSLYIWQSNTSISNFKFFHHNHQVGTEWVPAPFTHGNKSGLQHISPETEENWTHGVICHDLTMFEQKTDILMCGISYQSFTFTYFSHRSFIQVILKGSFFQLHTQTPSQRLWMDMVFRIFLKGVK